MDITEKNIIWCSKYKVERQQIEKAIDYLPKSLIKDWPKQKIAIITMYGRTGIRVSKSLRENREMIIISERLFPRDGIFEEHPIYKHFIFVVLHEIAHIFLDHPEIIPEDEKDEYEGAAHKQAKKWYDKHVAELGFAELDIEEMLKINEQIDIEFDYAVRKVRRKMSPPAPVSDCDGV